MKVLLDTQAFLWWDTDPAKLSPRASAALRDPANVLILSVVSAWELLIKIGVGKLKLKLPVAAMVAQQQASGLIILPVALDHVLAVELLPPVHKDPFDRLLIAQTIVEKAELVTADAVMASYPVSVIW